MDFNEWKPGEELSAENLNKHMLEFKAVIESMQAELALVTSGETLFSKGVPYDVASGVSVGKLVYIGKDGLCRPAQAVWRSEADANGTILPADSAYAAGVVIAMNPGAGTVDLVTRGRISNPSSAITAVLFGGVSSPWNGTWFLSQTTPGVVTRESDGLYMKVPVVKVDSAGGLYLTGAVPYAGYHVHKAFDIPAGSTWTAGDTTWTYAGNALDDLVFFNWKDVTFSIDGVEDYRGVLSLDISGSAAVLTATEDMSAHAVSVYVAIPDSHAEPVVRGLRTTGSVPFFVDAVNGLATLGFIGWDGEEPTPSYRDRAVSRIKEDGGYEMTKVVSGLVTDSTLSASEGADGRWYLGSLGGPLLKPMTIDLSNSTVARSNGAIYYIFPHSRVSSIMGTISVPAPAQGWHWEAVPFIQAAMGTVTVAASLVFKEDGAFDAAEGLPEAVLPSTVALTAAAGTGSAAVKAASGWDLSSGGTAWLNLAADGSSAADMNLLSFGLWIQAVED